MIARNLTLKVAIGAILMAALFAGGQITGLSETLVRSFQSPLPTPVLLPSPSPSPSPTPFPTISPDLPDAERALLFVAQQQGIPQEWLKLVDSSTIEFPLTGVTLWKGLVLDVKNRLHYLHEVFVDQSTKAILDDAQIDHLIYWQAEEKAFRQKYQEHILELVARREKVAAEELEIVWGGLSQDGGRWIWQGKLVDKTTGTGYQAAVDGQGQEIDFSEAVEAEARAQYAKYGKLEPALFERLEAAREDDPIEVAIWIAGDLKRSREDLYAELAEKYPESRKALEQSGNPFDVGDYKLINEIESEYVRLIEADVQEHLSPFVHYLQDRGYVVTTLGALPSIAVTLPRKAILDLVQRNEVGMIYLNEGKVQRLMDSAAPSDRAPSVWQRGYKGNGVSIGILEPDRDSLPPPKRRPTDAQTDLTKVWGGGV